MKFQAYFLLVACVFVGARQAAEPVCLPLTDPERARPSLGIAITPKNFPSHTAADVNQAFELARDISSSAIFIYQWSEFNLRTAQGMVEKAAAAGLLPILGLSPTTLDQQRKELDLPRQLRRRAARQVSFANPVIRTAYKQTARDLARLKPAYLCLATEINFLALQRLPEFLHFATLYKEAYREVKRISPTTQVFVSFQWEWMRIVDAKEPGRIHEHRKVIDIFRPELDLVAFTTYPSPFHASPASLPDDYYTSIEQHIERTDSVMLMEVGWPSAATGSEREQVAYLERLPELLRGIKVEVLAWALLHDIRHPAFDENLSTVGLITAKGGEKPSYKAFQELPHAF